MQCKDILRLYQVLHNYSNTSLLTRAAATMALTLKVFFAFALPVDTLKLPNVPMVARTTGGSENSSVTWMSEAFQIFS